MIEMSAASAQELPDGEQLYEQTADNLCALGFERSRVYHDRAGCNHE